MFPIIDNIPSRRPPIAVWGIIFANVLIFFAQLGLNDAQLHNLFMMFGVVPRRLAHPEWAVWVGFPDAGYLTLLTSMFLHGGWGHLLGNMWTLWIFGDNVEDRMGPIGFLLFYLLCGLVAGIVHVLVNPGSTVPTVGASGAISGVMAAYLVLYPTAGVITLVPILFYPLFITIPAVFYMMIWLATQLFGGAIGLFAPNVGGIAFWAHIGGFIAGAFLWPWFVRPTRRSRPIMRDEYGMEIGWRRDWL